MTLVARLLDISTTLLYETPSIALTGLPRRQRKLCKFLFSAVDWIVMRDDAQEALDEIVERGKPIDELPESGYGDEWNDYAAEGDDEDEEYGH